MRKGLDRTKIGAIGSSVMRRGSASMKVIRASRRVASGCAIALFLAQSYTCEIMASAPPSAPNWWLRGVIARSVGIVAIALGFVIGMDGLEHPSSHWLQTALGLLATGIVAQAYGLYCSIKRMRCPPPP